jgi:hypothetical protein
MAATSQDNYGNYLTTGMTGDLTGLPVLSDSIIVGSGSPSGVANATFVGQLYFDDVGLALYAATGIGTGSWTNISSGGGGVQMVVQVTNPPNGVTTGSVVGQIAVDTVHQGLWVFEGTPGQNTGWEQFD